MPGSENADSLASEDRPLATLPSGETRGLSNQARKRLGVHLRAMYDTVVQQPVPDRFKNLIAQLDDRPRDEREA